MNQEEIEHARKALTAGMDETAESVIKRAVDILEKNKQANDLESQKSNDDAPSGQSLGSLIDILKNNLPESPEDIASDAVNLFSRMMGIHEMGFTGEGYPDDLVYGFPDSALYQAFPQQLMARIIGTYSKVKGFELIGHNAGVNHADAWESDIKIQFAALVVEDILSCLYRGNVPVRFYTDISK